MDVMAEISEYVGLFETVQGNVNSMGLIWDHLIEEEVSLDHENYIVWIEQISDEFGLAVGYDPFHILEIHDTLTLNEIMGGIPLEVYHSNINVIHAREAAPVKIWWFGANVVHGTDVFFEEVVSNVHCRVTHTQAVPYYWRHIYESIDFKFHNIQPHPGINKVLFMQTGDLVNMRHSVAQKYYFNNRSDDRFFSYDNVTWGWGQDLEEPFMVDDYAIRDLGFKYLDHIFPGDSAESSWKGASLINEWFFAWDTGKVIHGWPGLIDENIGMVDTSVSPLLESLLEIIGVSADLSMTNWKAHLSIDDRIKVQSAAMLMANRMELILEGFGLSDIAVSVLVQSFMENVLDGLGLSSETVAGMFFLDIIEETVSGADSSQGNMITESTAADETGFEGSVN